jgi:hypothetical protein
MSILEKHRKSMVSEFVITDWLSPDEKYCIFLDELYDIENKTKIGDIWENFDNFKLFLKHSFEVAENIPQQIKEEVLTSINNLVLTENNQDFRMLKPFVKQMLQEGVFGDMWDWAKDTAKSAVTGVKDFAVGAWEGLKKTYNYIADGDWKEAFAIIGKGILWVARKIRSALYHPIGLILDAILVATGIGKAVQFVIWAVVVALDLYELISGDFEDKDLSMIWRLVFLGVDILGLVFAGVAAKGAKGVVGGMIRKFGATTEGLAKSVKESPALKGILEKILGASKSAEGMMNKAAGYLEKNAPKIYKFFSGVIGKLSGFVNKMVDGISGVLGLGAKVVHAPGQLAAKVVGGTGKSAKVVKTAVNVAVPLAGIGTYQKYKERTAGDELATGLSSTGVESEYDSDNL